MGQISPKLRRTVQGYAHWCPACQGIHVIGDSWAFDGKIDNPTFSPSVKVTYPGPDAGQLRDGHRAPAACCHYFLRAGWIEFCGDSTHGLAGQTIALPDLPPHLTDGTFHWGGGS
jgi:hypothetical protein